jgi:hypothetical protein
VLVVQEDLFDRILELAHELCLVGWGESTVGNNAGQNLVESVDPVQQQLQRAEHSIFQMRLQIGRCDQKGGMLVALEQRVPQLAIGRESRIHVRIHLFTENRGLVSLDGGSLNRRQYVRSIRDRNPDVWASSKKGQTSRNRAAVSKVLGRKHVSSGLVRLYHVAWCGFVRLAPEE